MPLKPVDNSPKIKISTRLNGVNKLTWTLPAQQRFDQVSVGCEGFVVFSIPFHAMLCRDLVEHCSIQFNCMQFKERVSASYGLPKGTVITLMFDGEKLTDAGTASSVGIVDDDLIDIQVPETW